MSHPHESLLDMLESGPSRIEAAVSGLTDEQLRARTADSEWSIAQVLAHVRASDDILAYRCYLILIHDHPQYYGLDERRWEDVVGYEQLDFAESLRAFGLRRTELVRMLRRAAPADFARTGVHATRGEQTLEAVLIVIAEHEHEHIAQMSALAALARR